MNYISALTSALNSIQQEHISINSQVILDAHRALLGGIEDEADPGFYRKRAVRVGRLILPPPARIAELMSDLEKYINGVQTPPLIKAALAHLQFETIHPYFDRKTCFRYSTLRKKEIKQEKRGSF